MVGGGRGVRSGIARLQPRAAVCVGGTRLCLGRLLVARGGLSRRLAFLVRFGRRAAFGLLDLAFQLLDELDHTNARIELLGAVEVLSLIHICCRPLST